MAAIDDSFPYSLNSCITVVQYSCTSCWWWRYIVTIFCFCSAFNFFYLVSFGLISWASYYLHGVELKTFCVYPSCFFPLINKDSWNLFGIKWNNPSLGLESFLLFYARNIALPKSLPNQGCNGAALFSNKRLPPPSQYIRKHYKCTPWIIVVCLQNQSSILFLFWYICPAVLAISRRK